MTHPIALLASFLALVSPSILNAETTAENPTVFIASITLTEIAEDGARTKLSEPRLRYVSGGQCAVSLTAEGGKGFHCAINSGFEGDPTVHHVSLKVTAAGDDGKPQILMAPELVVSTGRLGTVFVGKEPGPAIEVSVFVESADEDQ